MNKLNQNGISHILVIILIIVLAVVGIIGWTIYSKNHKKLCACFNPHDGPVLQTDLP